MIKQTAAQITGRAGERWFQGILPKEWTFQKPEEDIGLDGRIIIGSEHATGGFEFGVQIKSSSAWQIKDGVISVDGIKTDTLLYWGSRTFPTLLVLYDVSKKTGYCGWVFDLVSQPIEAAVPFAEKFNKKTLTLKMPEESILDEYRFKRIKIDVDNFYLNLINSITALRKSMNIIPIINSLAEALRGICVSFFQHPKNDDQIMLMGLLMVTSHKEVVRTLNKLLTKYQIEIRSTNFLQCFVTTYSNEVSKIIDDFDGFLEEDGACIVMTNPEAHRRVTPKLIDMILDLILILTDNEHKERGVIFTFE